MSYLGMGELLQKTECGNHTRIVIAVEEGYKVLCYILRVADSDPKMDVISHLQVGDKVIFSGEWLAEEKMDDFRFDWIGRKDFQSCSACGLAMVSEKCVLNHDKEAIKLFGKWKVVHARRFGRFIKVWFEKELFVFGAVSCAKLWIHRDFKTLSAGDYVELEGWRYQSTTTLKYVRILSI